MPIHPPSSQPDETHGLMELKHIVAWAMVNHTSIIDKDYAIKYIIRVWCRLQK
jgi:hypothetical protein